MEIGGRFAGSRFADGGRFGRLAAPILGALTLSILPSGNPAVSTDQEQLNFTFTGSPGGVYDAAVTLSVSDMQANGPALVVYPPISGTAAVGQAIGGLVSWWFGATDTAPVVTHQWLRDGVPIAGATGLTYTVALADQDADLTRRDTATDANGARVAVSNAIAIPAAPDDAVSQLAAALGGKLWAAYDLSDFANLAQNDDGTGAVTEAADPVEWYVDGSGNGRHLSTAGVTGGGNAIARTGYVESNNAGLKLASAPTGLSTTMEVYALIDLDGDATGILVGDAADPNTYAGAFEDGNTTQPLFGTFAGTPTFTIDGVAPSPSNRDGMHDALDVGGYATLGGQGVDLQTVGQDVMIMAYYNNVVGFSFSGRIKLIAITDALDAGERTSLHSIFDGEK